ncbi:Mis12-Mtw1 protein family-domain-containing protein [Scheffersomyces coipomensis]|uniref:Mis12-Mtw1 protein family-domain-containing protein n=1 Tax=Scheffersomyces coipomensis TaxID=1788519 RepID=UPI00315D5220
MPPKKRLGTSGSRVQTKSNPVKPSTTNSNGSNRVNKSNTTSSKLSSRAKLIEAEDDDVSDSDDISSQPNSQQILGRKNRLNDLLSHSQQSSIDSKSKSKSKQPPKLNSSSKSKPPVKSLKKPVLSRPNGKSNKSIFEEDEGFIYKRSQSVEGDSDVNNSKKKRKQISTPISILQEEMNHLSRDLDNDDDLHLLDLDNSKRTKKSSSSNTRKKPESNSRRHNFLDESSLQLSSPIKDIKETHDYSSDDYVEQVSHHTLTLDEPVNTGRNKNSTFSNHNTNNTNNNSSNKRRSSYYNRGKRVSSIGNGFVGEPHQDIPVSDYYKLLDTSLPEPDRVRQLLVWCIKKKLEQEDKTSNKKPTSTEDQTVVNIAKVIKEEVLKDLIEKQISTSWYSNFNTDDYDMPDKEIIIPNPLNEVNLQNIDIYTKKLKTLIKQKQQWEDAYNKSINPIKKMPDVINRDIKKGQLEDYIQTKNEEDGDSSVDAAVLDNSYLNNVTENFEQIKHKVNDNLESSVDKLYHTTYQLVKISEVVEALEATKLKGQVSLLLSDYMKRPEMRTTNIADAKRFDIWSKPVKSVDTKSLLRSLTRLGNSNSVTTSTTIPTHNPN